MIKVSIKLDKRRRLNNGKFPLKFKIARKDSTIYIPSGYELKEDEWDAKNEKVKNIPDYRKVNLKLIKKLALLNEKIEMLQNEGKLRYYSNKKLITYLSNKESDYEYREQLFSTQFEAFLDTKEKASTRHVYTLLKKRMEKFCDYESLRLEDIDIEWLDGFVTHMRKEHNAQNTIALRLCQLRSIINYARKKGLIQNYVFANYSWKKEETRKRALTVEELRLLHDAKLSRIREQYRDLFFLIFYLMGINIVDLSRLEKIENGRIHYRRAKTGTLYDIKVEPEALEIFEKYKGEKHLLKGFDKKRDYKNYGVLIDKMLSLISESLGLPKISMYWARHSFATIAYEIGISVDIIAGCLGHKSSHRITAIYIKKDQKLIDEANRKVIDYVLYNKL